MSARPYIHCYFPFRESHRLFDTVHYNSCRRLQMLSAQFHAEKYIPASGSSVLKSPRCYIYKQCAVCVFSVTCKNSSYRLSQHRRPPTQTQQLCLPDTYRMYTHLCRFQDVPPFYNPPPEVLYGFTVLAFYFIISLRMFYSRTD